MEYAWYSAESDEQFGHFTVELVSGEVVKATERADSPDQPSNWTDRVALGQFKRVVQFNWKPEVERTWLGR